MDVRSDYPPKQPGTDGPPVPAQRELEATFKADDADVAAGRIAPAKPVLAQMRATTAGVRRERHAKEVGAAGPVLAAGQASAEQGLDLGK